MSEPEVHRLTVTTIARILDSELAGRVREGGTPEAKWIVQGLDSEVADDVVRAARQSSPYRAFVWRFTPDREIEEGGFTASSGPLVKSRDQGCYVAFSDPRSAAQLPASLFSNQAVVHTTDLGSLSPVGIVRRTASTPEQLGLETFATVDAETREMFAERVVRWFVQNRAQHMLVESWFRWLLSLREQDGGWVHDQRALAVLPSDLILDLAEPGEAVVARFDWLCSRTRDPSAAWRKVTTGALLDRIQSDGPTWIIGRLRDAERAGDVPAVAAWRELESHLVRYDYQVRREFPEVLREWPVSATVELLDPEAESSGVYGFRVDEASRIAISPESGQPVVSPDADLVIAWNVEGIPNGRIRCRRTDGPVRSRRFSDSSPANSGTLTIPASKLPSTDIPIQICLEFELDESVIPGERVALLIAPTSTRPTRPVVDVRLADGTILTPDYLSPDPSIDVAPDEVAALRVWVMGSDGTVQPLASANVRSTGTGEEKTAETVDGCVCELPNDDSDWPWRVLRDAGSVQLSVDAGSGAETALELVSKAATDLPEDGPSRAVRGVRTAIMDAAKSLRVTEGAFKYETSVVTKGDGSEGVLHVAVRVGGARKTVTFRPPVSDELDRLERAVVTEDRRSTPWPRFLEANGLGVGAELVVEPSPDEARELLEFLRLRAEVFAALESKVSAVPLTWALSTLSSSLVFEYTDAWAAVLRRLTELRNANGDSQQRKVLLRTICQLAAVDSFVSSSRGFIALSPMHPVNLMWQRVAQEQGRVIQNAADLLTAWAAANPDWIPPFLTLAFQGSDEVHLYTHAAASGERGWALLVRAKTPPNPEEERQLDAIVRLAHASTPPEPMLETDRVQQAISDYHRLHPLRRDIAVRWVGADDGSRDWRSDALGSKATKALTGGARTLQRRNYSNLTLDIGIVSEVAETTWAVPPSDDAGRAVLDRVRRVNATERPAFADVSFLPGRRRAGHGTHDSGPFACLVGGGLVLEPGKRFDVAGSEITLRMNYAIHPTVKGGLATLLRILQPIAAIRESDALTDERRFTIASFTLGRSQAEDRPFLDALKGELRGAKWVFISGAESDPEYFDHVANDPEARAFIVQYRPRLPWYRSVGRGDAHGLIAVTAERKTLSAALASHIASGRFLGEKDATAPEVAAAAERLLQALNRYAPREISRIGHPFAHRQGTLGMGVVADLFPAQADATGVRLLLPIDDHWDELVGEGRHADWLDLLFAIRPDGVDVFFQVIEVKNRGSQQGDWDTDIDEQIGGAIRELVENSMIPVGPTASIRAANMLAMTDHHLRRAFARARTGGASDVALDAAYDRIRSDIAAGAYRIAPFPEPDTTRGGTLVSIDDEEEPGDRAVETQAFGPVRVELVRVARDVLESLLLGEEDACRRIRDIVFPRSAGLPIVPPADLSPADDDSVERPPAIAPAQVDPPTGTASIAPSGTQPGGAPSTLPPSTSSFTPTTASPVGSSPTAAQPAAVAVPTPASGGTEAFVHPAFEGFIGNSGAVRQVSLQLMYAERMSERKIQSLLLSGSKSTGKTELSKRISGALGVPRLEFSRSTLSSADDLADAILRASGPQGAAWTNRRGGGTRAPFVAPPMMVFIDEVHTLQTRVVETLLTATEPSDRNLLTQVGKIDTSNITFVIATTKSGKLDGAFRTRFNEVPLDDYTLDQVVEILRRRMSSPEFDPEVLRLDTACLEVIVTVARLVPRVALELMVEVGKALALGAVSPTADSLRDHFKLTRQADQYGLIARDRKYLDALYQTRQAGIDQLTRVVGITAVTLEEEVEPFLMKKGWVALEPNGRKLTDAGRRLVAELRRLRRGG